MRKFLSILFITVGIVLISLPFLSNKYLEYKIKANQDILEDISAEELKKNESIEAEYDYSLIDDIDPSLLFSEMEKNYGESMIGQIVIADLGINLPIMKGTTNSNLLAGATTMRPDQKMGQGNYPLAGHYARNKSVLFASLLDIEKDTIVKITNKETIYEYKIYDVIIVPDTSIHLIEDKLTEDRGRPVISLMTCYYTSKNGKRFFALGELVDEYDYASEKLIE